ncbi:MAG TPA: PQQ-binding-like beta-propeller repeat protein [Verrucomicrobiae bacterium]
MRFSRTLLLKPAICALIFVALVDSRAGEIDAQYFRSDRGVADPACGKLPSEFDSSGNLRWRIPLDSGHATPILSGGKIFLTAYQEATRELAVLAIDAETGKVLWHNGVTVSAVEQTHPLGSPATATPACDGQRVFAFFGSYGLLAFDLNGKKLWEYKAGPFQDEYGAGSSPALFNNEIILNQDHDVDSFVMAIDTATGKLLWKTPRPDAVRSYSTPVMWSHNGQPELLVAGALELAAYDPGDGKRLWWINGLARIVIPTAVPSGDTIYMASWAPGGDAVSRITLDSWPVALSKWDANHDGKLSHDEIKDHEVQDRFFRMDLNQDGLLDQHEWEHHAQIFQLARNSLLAIKPGGVGELPASTVTWKHLRGVPYVSTPVIDHGILYMVKEGGIVTKLDAGTGLQLQEERVAGLGNYFASPVAGDGKVYFCSEPGNVTVIASQPEWKVISSHDFHERIYASPLLANGSVYIRTEKALYRFQTPR